MTLIYFILVYKTSVNGTVIVHTQPLAAEHLMCGMSSHLGKLSRVKMGHYSDWRILSIDHSITVSLPLGPSGIMMLNPCALKVPSFGW